MPTSVCATRHRGKPREPDGEAVRGRQPPRHVRHEAVRGHDVEADARHHHDGPAARLRVAHDQRLDDRDLAGDVEVVDAGREARVDHRACGGRERAGRVQHDPHPVEGAAERGRIVETDDPMLDAERLGQLGERPRVPPREAGREPRRRGGLCDEATRVSGRAVDQKPAGHRAG
jgi:hypothetical protein